MYLKELQLHGFKSFAKKSALEFTSPVTAVVGPNGSGKSNIVEAIRFVLGEQSMKSLRGKAGTDLIFKGSKSGGAMNRAHVSLVFNNKDKVFTFTNSDNNRASLDYDEITITREVYSDGANRYLINGTEVRLKDIVELLASVNIGTSGHHIISQGEADRVLNANSKDRRGMIEDALGLKVYQYKIRESERKLEKTLENIKDVQSLRREIAPHLTFLKKQVEKIEKAREMREEVKGYYHEYLSNESAYIHFEQNKLSKQKNEDTAALHDLEAKIEKVERNRESKGANPTQAKINELSKQIGSLRSLAEELSRKVGRLEGMIEIEERRAQQGHHAAEQQAIPFGRVENIFKEIEGEIERALAQDSLDGIRTLLSAMRSRLGRFLADHRDAEDVLEKEGAATELLKLKEEETILVKEIEAVRSKERALETERRRLEEEQSAEAAREREHEREYFEYIGKRNELRSSLQLQAVREEAITKRATDFEEAIREGAVLVGPDAVRYSERTHGEHFNAELQEELRRKIERIKIKLEDIGGGNGSEVLKEYDDTRARDEFLVRELTDLETSIASLKDLIHELKDTLDREFKVGVDKINKQFNEFFALMFGGGAAFLSVVVEHKKKRNKNTEDEDGEEFEEEDEKMAFEEGIEINVSMPHKKVKDLHMLSGGERSLTSIALLFAISQVNPPPFLVLDETDAALDEANSRKYGNMIENLSRFSQLIVVTHNRETMSRAQVLYGVTIGSDSGSKLLSIKFDEAVAIAK